MPRVDLDVETMLCLAQSAHADALQYDAWADGVNELPMEERLQREVEVVYREAAAKWRATEAKLRAAAEEDTTTEEDLRADLAHADKHLDLIEKLLAETPTCNVDHERSDVEPGLLDNLADVLGRALEYAREGRDR